MSKKTAINAYYKDADGNNRTNILATTPDTSSDAHLAERLQLEEYTTKPPMAIENAIPETKLDIPAQSENTSLDVQIETVAGKMLQAELGQEGKHQLGPEAEKGLKQSLKFYVGQQARETQNLSLQPSISSPTQAAQSEGLVSKKAPSFFSTLYETYKYLIMLPTQIQTSDKTSHIDINAAHNQENKNSLSIWGEINEDEWGELILKLKNNSLITLRVRNSELTKDQKKELGNAFEDNTSLLSLNFRECNIGADKTGLIKKLPINLIDLSLARNKIETNYLSEICQALPRLTSLNSLNLAYNNMKLADMCMLSKMLKQTYINYLNIEKCNLTKNDFKLLFNGIDCSYLTTLVYGWVDEELWYEAATEKAHKTMEARQNINSKILEDILNKIPHYRSDALDQEQTEELILQLSYYQHCGHKKTSFYLTPVMNQPINANKAILSAPYLSEESKAKILRLVEEANKVPTEKMTILKKINDLFNEENKSNILQKHSIIHEFIRQYSIDLISLSTPTLPRDIQALIYEFAADYLHTDKHAPYNIMKLYKQNNLSFSELPVSSQEENVTEALTPANDLELELAGDHQPQSDSE